MAFNENDYFSEKLMQLNATGAEGRKDWTLSDVQKGMADAGLTAQQHYEQWGKGEGLKAPGSTALSPPSASNLENTYLKSQGQGSTFDRDTYLANKALQLNQNKQFNKTDWTAEDVATEFARQGFTPESHFEQWGKNENVNPYTGALAGVGTPNQGGSYSDIAAGRLAAGTGIIDSYDPTKTGRELDANVNIQSGLNYVDQAKSTVAGQLQSILASNNPYVKQQQAMALEASAGRGLRNSTIAEQMGQDAANQAALQIATPDAATYASAQRAQQSADYNLETIQGEAIVSGNMIEQQTKIARRTQGINDAFQANMAQADADQAVYMAQLQQGFNQSITELESTNRKILLDTELTYNQATNVANQAASILENYQISYERLLTSPDFLQLDPAAAQNAIDNLYNITKSTIGFIGASNGINMDAYVDNYFQGA